MPERNTVPENRAFKCETCGVSGTFQEMSYCEEYHKASKMTAADFINKLEFYGYLPMSTGDDRIDLPKPVKISRNFVHQGRWTAETFLGNLSRVAAYTATNLVDNFRLDPSAEEHFWKRTRTGIEAEINAKEAEIAELKEKTGRIDTQLESLRKMRLGVVSITVLEPSSSPFD